MVSDKAKGPIGPALGWPRPGWSGPPDLLVQRIVADLQREVTYDQMTDEQKRIADAGNEIAGTFPQGLTKDEFIAWMMQRFGL